MWPCWQVGLLFLNKSPFALTSSPISIGLCAIVAATKFKPKHLFAVDSVASRLEQARSLGAEPLNFQTDMEGLKKRIKDVTDGRGADLCLEIVGLSPALRLAFDLIRPWGVISSVGVHNGEVRSLVLLFLKLALMYKSFNRYLGQPMKHITKIYAYRQVAVLYAPFSPKRWKCCSRNRTSLGK